MNIKMRPSDHVTSSKTFYYKGHIEFLSHVLNDIKASYITKKGHKNYHDLFRWCVSCEIGEMKNLVKIDKVIVRLT